MTTATAVAIVIFQFFAEINGLYRPWRSERLSREMFETVATWLFVPPVLFLLAFGTKTSADFSRLASMGWFIVTPMVLLLWRAGVRLGLRRARARGRNIRNVAVVGATAGAETLMNRIEDQPWLGCHARGLRRPL